MRKYYVIEYMLIFILLVLFGFALTGTRLFDLARKEVYAYNKDLTLREEVSTEVTVYGDDFHYETRVLSEGTVISAQFIRVNGNVYNLNLKTDPREPVSIKDLPAEYFEEEETIKNDLSLLIDGTKQEIRSIIIRMIVISLFCLLISGVVVFVIHRKGIPIKTHKAIVGILALSIVLMIGWFLVLVFLTR